jgi:formylglycine-generating enzyme required for sulfatase activity
VLAKHAVFAGGLGLAGCGRVDFDPAVTAVVDGSRDGQLDGTQAGSCPGLPSICGPTGSEPCCGSLLVPGGTFYRSFDYGTDAAYTDMTNAATVSDFRLDRYEVTVGRFRQFVDAGMGTQSNPPAAGAGARALAGLADQGGWDPAWNASLTADTAALSVALDCSAQSPVWTDARPERGADFTVSSSRSERGGSFINHASYSRIAYRGTRMPDIRDRSSGVRCARAP